ncbi:MAG: acyl-CoA ligase (AMP-forming), exosortase A system-associated [Candidatus Scalindua sp.]|nr:acyl-CoA ligase (AMP-forming), exosortase A system-associated [Candidatus Scalindua sp.]
MITQTILKDSSTRFLEKKAIASASKQITYKELEESSGKLAALLIENGAERGDRIGVYLPKSIEEVISIFAIGKAGGIFVLLNPVLKKNQVEHIANDCGIKILISNSYKLRNIDNMIHGFKSVLRIFLFEENFEQIPNISSKKIFPVSGFLEKITDCLIQPICIPSDIATIIYTSGCTGTPKGIMTTHQNLMEGAEIISNYLNMNNDDVILSILPFSFDYGLDQLLTTIRVGGTIVLHDFLFSEETLKTMEEQKITGLAGVPAIWNRIVEMKNNTREHDFTSLRYITNSGGKLTRETIFRLMDVFPESKLYLMYGLTEAHRSTYLDPSMVRSKPDSIGKAIPNVEIYVLNKEDKMCKPGEVGELVHRGALISRGYWNDPFKTDEIFRQNPLTPSETFWSEKVVYSGDLVKSDEEGFLYYVGRRDEMIKKMGYRVSPVEVEEAISKMNKFWSVVAVGIEQKNLEQEIFCFVVLKKGAKCTKREILHFLRNSLPSYMIPGEIIFKERVPHTPSGKIDRALLRKEAYTFLHETH